MADLIDDTVFNAALDLIETADNAQVRTSGSSVLVDCQVNSVTLDSGNFTQGPGSPSGRRTQCLVSAASDMKAISVSAGGAANQVALLDSASTVLAMADLPAPVSLGSSDQVNLGPFYIQFPDA